VPLGKLRQCLRIVRGLRQLCSSTAGSSAHLHNSKITVAGYKTICNGFLRQNPARFSVSIKNKERGRVLRQESTAMPFVTMAQAEAYAT
jgi:hypothetical protein